MFMYVYKYVNKHIDICMYRRSYMYNRCVRATTGTCITCRVITTTKSGCKSFRGYDATGSVCIFMNYICLSTGTCKFFLKRLTSETGTGDITRLAWENGAKLGKQKSTLKQGEGVWGNMVTKESA